jgi:signal transduction histidine kinase
MVALNQPTPARPSAPNPALFTCQWEQDLHDAGVDHAPSRMVRYAVPAMAVAGFVIAILAAVLAPDSGNAAAPAAIALTLVAIVPWAQWLVRGDSGPTVANTLWMTIPPFLLGIGHWFVPEISLGSGAAYAVIAFPVLLLVILGLAVAETTALTITIPLLAAIATGGPLVAATVAGKDVDLAAVVVWLAAFALSVVAGWAIQRSDQAYRAVSAAREQFARQEAAEERRQIARDVHDVVAHTLSVTMLHITAARMAVKRDDDAVALAALEEAERQGRSSLSDIRRLIALLRADSASSIAAPQPGLADIDSLVRGYQVAGLPVSLTSAIDGARSTPTAELAIYRVVQEALTNAARHGSGPASVAIDCAGGTIRLTVENAWQPDRIEHRGSGLAGMRERIAAAGGTVDIGARDGRWVVAASVPIEVAA